MHPAVSFPINNRYTETDLASGDPIIAGIVIADGDAMMTVITIGAALAAAGFLTELFAANKAPLGYQDDAGFHFGQAHTGAQFELENPS